MMLQGLRSSSLVLVVRDYRSVPEALERCIVIAQPVGPG